MKEVFLGYYHLTEEDYTTLLTDCIFILDASFLCGLYRLPISASDDLFKVLRHLSSRLWVPHQAALEFHRNRLSIIAEQKKKFSTVREILSTTRQTFKSSLANLDLKKRHSLIKQEALEQKFDEFFKAAEVDLSDYEACQIDVHEDDTLLAKLDDLLKDKIGPAPVNQEEIDTFYEEAKNRYGNKIPPGFADSFKAKSEEPIYTYGGIIYQRQFGDFILWKQILSYTSTNEIKSVVLLTNDLKEDWFWIVGGKTVGPRPELRDEIFRLSGVKLFHIYSSEQFLKISKQYFGIEIPEDSVKAAGDMIQLAMLPGFKNIPVPRQTFLEQVLEEILPDFVGQLVNEDELVCSRMAETNALGYGLDFYEILNADYDPSSDRIEFTVDVFLSGEQNPDMGYCGDNIYVNLSGTLKYSNGYWEIDDYEIESCEIQD